MSPPQNYAVEKNMAISVSTIYPFTPESRQSETVTKNANFFFCKKLKK